MSGSSGLKPPSSIFTRNTGAKPKAKISKLTPPRSLRSSPVAQKKQEVHFESPFINETKNHSDPSRRYASQILECSPKKSPRRFLNSEERILQNNSPKRGTRNLSSIEDEMGLSQLTISTAANSEDSVMSFVEFESLYTLEKELMQSKSDVLSQLDEKCIFGGWFGPGRYNDSPDSIRNSEGINLQAIAADPFTSQTSLEGFSFAPGWALNAEHFYQWQQRGKTTQQVKASFPNSNLSWKFFKVVFIISS